MSLTLERSIPNLTLDTCLNAPSTEATFTVETTRFGKMEAEEEAVLTLPEGVIGFEKCQRYILVRQEENSSFRWLQSLERPELAFPILEPRDFRPDYAPTISDSDARVLQITAETPVLMFSVITVPAKDPQGMTANLLGPIIVNGFTRQGKQVIVLDEEFTTRHSVIAELKRSQERLERMVEEQAA